MMMQLTAPMRHSGLARTAPTPAGTHFRPLIASHSLSRQRHITRAGVSLHLYTHAHPCIHCHPHPAHHPLTFPPHSPPPLCSQALTKVQHKFVAFLTVTAKILIWMNLKMHLQTTPAPTLSVAIKTLRRQSKQQQLRQ